MLLTEVCFFDAKNALTQGENDISVVFTSPELDTGIFGKVEILKFSGAVIENIGWAIITNLSILFAVAIGGSWAKDRAGGAFAAQYF